jgi:hypothetical protein
MVIYYGQDPDPVSVVRTPRKPNFRFVNDPSQAKVSLFLRQTFFENIFKMCEPVNRD